eukprot:GEZU01021093.1.p1 GENE.GEZU01021093.1~~GEZU01021093.1.p1  ORF type:complete len:509 (-),score=173.60 GEZU01021093.1:43-1569(-)
MPEKSAAYTIVAPKSFDSEKHFYPRVLNAQVHPMISYFFSLGNARIIDRYCHLHPGVSPKDLEKILGYKANYFRWAGADLFNVTTSSGTRHMIIIETNSCPSGQKSMPILHEHQEQGGYNIIMEKTFKPHVDALKDQLPEGGLAVVYDKNLMEASGYAAAMADVFQENVHLVAFHSNDKDPPVRFTADGVMEVRDSQGSWLPIRAAWRYVTQQPWNRIPISTRTYIHNPIVSCLAGGRNKMVASKAYDIYNAELGHYGLVIRTPETIRDVNKNEIPLWIENFGGYAVVKNPYSNAGQGVWTITNRDELREFMDQKHQYDQFIVQQLIGNHKWSSYSRTKQYFHVGTVPDKNNNIYVADIRMMVSVNQDGFQPLAIYARRARLPLPTDIASGTDSWDILGTNLSVKTGNSSWDTETNRLLLMDRKDFNTLGISIDDLIDAYIQTVLAVIAIDKMCCKLMIEDGKFNYDLFSSLNNDKVLLKEIEKANLNRCSANNTTSAPSTTPSNAEI